MLDKLGIGEIGVLLVALAFLFVSAKLVQPGKSWGEAIRGLKKAFRRVWKDGPPDDPA